jgi:type I restriction enzyme S subunit
MTLPAGWVQAPLGDTLELKYGKSLPERLREPGKFCVYGSNGVVGTHVEPLTAGKTIIVGRKGSAGKVHRSLSGCFPIDTTYYVDDFSILEFGFAAALLNGLGLDKMDRATAVPGLNREEAYALPVAIPPIAEQRRIVAKLDALTARLTRARAELDRVQYLAARFRDEARASAYTGELTRDLRDGREATWPLRPLQAIAQVVTGSTPPTADKALLFGGDIPFVKPTDLDAGYSVSVPRETLTEAGAGRSRVVPARSTLVTCIGATIAKTGFARVRCAFNQQINAVVPNAGQVEPRWLYWAITAPAFRASIIDNASATTMPIINKGRFQALELPMPPLHEQAAIADRLEAAFARADRLEAEAARARALLERLEAAILARAFRGELVPQDPADEPASALLDRIRANRAAAPKVKRRRKALEASNA